MKDWANDWVADELDEWLTRFGDPQNDWLKGQWNLVIERLGDFENQNSE